MFVSSSVCHGCQQLLALGRQAIIYKLELGSSPASYVNLAHSEKYKDMAFLWQLCDDMRTSSNSLPLHGQRSTDTGRAKSSARVQRLTWRNVVFLMATG